MTEWLGEILVWDKQVTLLINQCHRPWLDEVMWYISYKWTWIPFYAGLLYLLVKKYKQKTWIILIAVVVLILMTDQSSVHFFKNTIQRLRPCHDSELGISVHLVRGYCGGLYGFLSSHAANSMALAFFYGSVMRLSLPYKIGMYLWAWVVGLSRVYLGVHYLLDVLAGLLWGYFLAKYLLLFLSRWRGEFP